MITIKIHGHKEASSVIGDIARKALTNVGVIVTHWQDVTPGNRLPHIAARKEKAGVLILEMRK